jgi:hypothetical protein
MLLSSNLNFGKLESQNMRIQNLSSAPSSPLEGQVYYDTTLHQFGCFQNSTWVYLSAAGSANVSKASNASAANVIQVSGGLDKTIQDFTSAGGIIKVTSTGVASIATIGTDYVTGSSTNTFTNKTFDAAGTGNALSNIATSMFAANVVDTDGTFAANSDTRIPSQKAVVTYVQSNVQGLSWKPAAHCATTGGETYTIATGAVTQITGTVVDGYSPAVGEFIVVKNAPAATGAGAGAGTANTTQPANGIYTVSSNTTNLTVARATFADTAAEIRGSVIDVMNGTTNADTAWNMITDGAITLNTTGLTFTDFIKANVPVATTSVAGKVTLATQAEAEAKADTAKAVVSADLVNFPIKKSFTIGDGATTAIVVTHNLGTKDIHVMVRDFTTDAGILVDWTATSTNTATITFAVAPATNAYRAVIIG